MTNDINYIIDKYFKGESTLEEERALQKYMLSDRVEDQHVEFVPLFKYYEHESTVGTHFEPDLSFTQKSRNKVRFLWPKIITVAASLVLLFALADSWIGVEKESVYKNKYTEIEDPHEGLSIALETLGFASQKLDMGIQPVSHLKELPNALQSFSHIKELKRTTVFNFDK